jgi:proline iminopeptidase
MMLSVGHGHELYYAEFGNPQGMPLLFVHGGPGSGCNPAHAQLLYPEGFRIIQLDQRGCGQSQPLGAIKANTTADLIADMEALRQHLNLERWAVYGGSWGTVLALEYAKLFPARVLGVLLRGVFLARHVDWDWFALPEGVAQYFPEHYQTLLKALGLSVDQDPAQRLNAYLHADPETAYRAALAWDAWESAVMRVGAPSFNPDQAAWEGRIARTRIYAHYAANQFFLPEEGVLRDLESVGELPIYAVHGKQDLVCRYSGAELLNEYLANYHLVGVEAGHNIYEASLANSLQASAKLLFDALKAR